MNMTSLIADPANHAAPAPSAGSATHDLRAELADAIEAHRAADADARAAADVADRAADAEHEAAAVVAHLRQALDDAQARVIREYAMELSAAFRMGAPLPPPPDQPEGDSPALAFAVAHWKAVQQSASELAAEAAAARDEAITANSAVMALVEQIMLDEAPALAAEAVAAIELHWAAIDRLKGLILIDEARPGGPRLRAFQEDLLERIDRRKASIAKDPRYIEQHNWSNYLNDLSAAQKLAWLDYRKRLMDDSAALFDAEALPQ